MKHRPNDLSKVVHLATIEGLSYGQYVAKELDLRTQRKPPPLNYISINERIQHGIGFPIYSGKTTLQAAAWTDFERSLKNAKKGARNNEDHIKVHIKVS